MKGVADGCAIPEELLPRLARAGRPERDALKDERLRKLKKWREAKSLALGIDAGFLVNNALLEVLAKEAPKDAAGLDVVPALRGWRKREFGDELLEVLC